MSEYDDAYREFEERWNEAVNQPEVVEPEGVEAISVDVGTTPMLNRMRLIADSLLEQKLIDQAQKDAIHAATMQIDEIFASVDADALAAVRRQLS